MPFANYADRQAYDAHRRSQPKERELRKIRMLALSIIFKIRCVVYKGGKCQKCGYEKCHTALDFHHRDNKEKEFGINIMRGKSWAIVTAELDKCDLLCANCHREQHFDPNPIKRSMNYIINRNSKYMGDKIMVDYTDIIEYIIKTGLLN